jgi:predicted nucleic acid-binding protein
MRVGIGVFLLKRIIRLADWGYLTASLDVLAAVAEPVESHFLWRPRLRDADDHMVLEAATNGRADAIATFNTREFAGVAREFAIAVLTPTEILRRL